MSQRHHPEWTREECVEAVKAFAAVHGYQPISNEAGPRNGLPQWATAKRLFGGWNAMVEAAGFVPYPAKNSGLAKTRAFRDRNPDWRERLMKGVRVKQAGPKPEAMQTNRETVS